MSAVQDMLAELDRRYSFAVIKHQAGVEARYLVRGGQDHRFATPEARDAEVRRLLRDRSLSAGEAAMRVAAFLRGWVHSHPDVVR